MINCIGDSHVSLFSESNLVIPDYSSRGYDKNPNYRTHRLDPILMWLMHIKEHESYKKVIEKLHSFEIGSEVLLSFGEIDCRMQVLKQAERQNKPYQEICKEIIDLYFENFVFVIQNDYNLIVYGPCPNREKIEDGWWIGTQKERNIVIEYFNLYLERKCKKNDIKFLTFFWNIINKDYTVKEELYCDPIHESSICLEFLKDS